MPRPPATSRPPAPSRPRAAAIVRAIREAYPAARVELAHDDPFQLLIATILSAQSTDARVNQVTPGLFRRYPDPAAFAAAPLEEIEAAIHSTGFFRAKARAIQGCSRALVERHGGGVPRTMEELTALPGVGRKTANVVLGAGYGIASGIVVDTHMARVAARLGLTRQADPVKIEKDLMPLVPRDDWVFFSIAMILHGRYVCQARLPRCSACPLFRLCPSNFLEAGILARRGGAGGVRRPVTTRSRPAAGPRQADRRPRPRRGRS